MKRIISVVMVLVMIIAFEACSNNKYPSAPSETDVTQAANSMNAEPSSEPVPEPDHALNPERDESYDAGHVHKGLYLCDNGWSLTIEPESAGVIIFVFEGKTDKENFGSYHELWTTYDDETKTFVSDGDIFHYRKDGMTTAYSEEKNTFKVIDDTIIWLNNGIDFQKVSDNIMGNPNYVDSDYYGDGYDRVFGDGFGAEFVLASPEMIDIVATTFYGVCCEKWSNSADSFYFPYNGEEMSVETMDEFDAAYLELGMGVDQGHLYFPERGVNSDVTWKKEDEKIFVTDSYSSDVYEGWFYSDPIGHKIYVCLWIGEYNIWMTYNTVGVEPIERL